MIYFQWNVINTFAMQPVIDKLIVIYRVLKLVKGLMPAIILFSYYILQPAPQSYQYRYCSAAISLVNPCSHRNREDNALLLQSIPRNQRI